jgi:hypothetical protein
MPIVAEIEQIPSPMVQLVVNGTKVETQADPGMPLLWFLRVKSARQLRRALRLGRRIGAPEQPFADLPLNPRHARIVAEIRLCERELIGATAPIHAAIARHRKKKP